MNILISLQQGYGLGDAVQMSAVLRHVIAARPNWHIDFQAEEGKHQVGRGIVANTFAFSKKYPSEHYDGEIQILLYDTWANWHDRPNTRVSSCLHERFGLPWQQEYGRYQVQVSEDALDRARYALFDHGKTHDRLVAVHYLGDSSPSKKNLRHEQAGRICEYVERLNYIPIILDWRRNTILPYRKLWAPQEWGKNAEMVCAAISQCKAFVGIDSGPSKCASATDTPSLVIWTGYHPAPFHDPSPNTTHLVPYGYHGLEPVCNDRGVMNWFESHYSIRTYWPDPVVEVRKWLEEILK